MIMQFFENLASAAPAKLLVVGDLILDQYIVGTTERTSPEAPVPVVLVQREQDIPGGAANVARNITAAGGSAACLGTVGDDVLGRVLVAAMQQDRVDCQGVVQVNDRVTTTKTRIVSQGQQIARLDREIVRPVDVPAEAALQDAVRKLIPDCRGVIISDYAKGVVTQPLFNTLVEECNRLQIPLIVDPKGRNYARYRGAFALTPNAREAYEATGISTNDEDGLRQAAAVIMMQTDCQVLVITRGASGVAVFSRDSEDVFLPTYAREVYDVTGAGDTFVAYLTFGLAGGLGAADAATLANAAAGVVVGKVGAATVGMTEVRAALLPERLGRKLRTPADLASLGESLRRAGKRIVFTNGCFDFLHAGHVSLIQRARALGDVLILATNSDEMIRQIKGAGRPVLRQEDRLPMLASIEAVDYLAVFEQETPNDLLRALKPDILVKGSNLQPDEVEGRTIVESQGGKVVQLDVLPAFSTHEMLTPRKS